MDRFLAGFAVGIASAFAIVTFVGAVMWPQKSGRVAAAQSCVRTALTDAELQNCAKYFRGGDR